MKNHTVFTVTKSSMDTGQILKTKDFAVEKEAINYYNEIISKLGYESRELDNGFSEAGGMGHDFHVEFEWNNF